MKQTAAVEQPEQRLEKQPQPAQEQPEQGSRSASRASSNSVPAGRAEATIPQNYFATNKKCLFWKEIRANLDG
jgi:hypothetical protein